MQCPICGAMELEYKIEDIAHTHKGCTGSIRDVIAPQCPQCQEFTFRFAEAGYVSNEMLLFNSRVPAASVIDEKFVERVRKKLDLNQRQAAAIFGGGINAFSLYENGSARPSVALIKLLAILDRHPQLLDEIQILRI